MLSRGLKRILSFTAIVFVISLVYFIYAYLAYPKVPERETFLTEMGEGFGEIGLWLLLFIYGRTLLKILIGKGNKKRGQSTINSNFRENCVLTQFFSDPVFLVPYYRLKIKRCLSLLLTSSMTHLNALSYQILLLHKVYNMKKMLI